MMRFSLSFFLPLLLIPATTANCPLPANPHLPISSLSEADMTSFAQSLTVDLDQQVREAASSSESNANVSISISVVGVEDPPLFTYNFGPNGSIVTSDSIYRIASISKIFPIYEALLSGLNLDDPVSKWLSAFAKDEYDGITLRGLAGHVGGLTRDCK